MDARAVILRALVGLGYTVHHVSVVPDYGTSYFLVAVECSADGERRDNGGLFDSYSVADPVQIRSWVEAVWERVEAKKNPLLV